jgi:hypothetical protein
MTNHEQPAGPSSQPALAPAAPSRAVYDKPVLRRLGLLRRLTRFSF